MIHETAKIHPTALVEKGAKIDRDVEIGPYSTIGANVSLGRGTKIFSHTVIKGFTQIGEENTIFSFACIGEIPQDLKYKGEDTKLIIGNKNTLREFVTIQAGTIQDNGETILGDENLIMNYVHIAHDCRIGNSNIISNQSQLAGHVIIGNMTVVSGFVGFHHFVRVGDLAMAAGGALISKDLPPYCLAAGTERASLRSLNFVGMKRRGIPAAARDAVKQAYKIMFLSNFPSTHEAAQAIESQGLTSYPEVVYFVDFIQSSKRGVLRPASKDLNQDSEDEIS